MAGVQYPGSCFISSNSGGSWSLLSAPLSTNKYYSAVVMDSAGLNIFVASYSGYIYRSTNSGFSFTSSAQNGEWYSLACSSQGQYIIGVQSPGQIWLSQDLGNSWVEVYGVSSNTWYAVCMSRNGRYVTAALNGGGIYRSSNFGIANSWYYYNSYLLFFLK